MKHHIRKLLRSNFIKNVTVMASGAAGAQAITMLLSPIITRQFGPDAFGILGTFNSLINIIIPIAALTYPIAIVLPKDDQDATGLIRLSLIITSFISLLTLLILLGFESQIINIFNIEEISGFIYLLPLVIIFSGIMQVAEQWLIRTKQFSINARVSIYQSFITNGSKVGFGFIHPVASVLVVLTALGNGIKALMMIVLAKRSNYQVHSKKKKKISTLAKEYYDFPMYRAPEAFLNAVSNSLPILMLTSFFGPAAAGFYTICRTVLAMPSRLIGKAVGDVFYPRIAEAAHNKEDLPSLIKRATLLLGVIGIFPFGIIVAFGPFLFSFVFGSEWVVAGEYARWIAFWSFFAFINRPSVQSLPVLNAQRFHLVYTVIMLIVRLLALSVGYLVFSSDIIAVALFGLSGALLNFGLISITLRISQKRTSRGLKE